MTRQIVGSNDRFRWNRTSAVGRKFVLMIFESCRRTGLQGISEWNLKTAISSLKILRFWAWAVSELDFCFWWGPSSTSSFRIQPACQRDVGLGCIEGLRKYLAHIVTWYFRRLLGWLLLLGHVANLQRLNGDNTRTESWKRRLYNRLIVSFGSATRHATRLVE